MKAHIIEISQAATGLIGGGTGFITALQEANLVLGLIAAIIGILVGGHALYQIMKSRPPKP